MKTDRKIRSGYRVYGPNTSNGDYECWYFPTLEDANAFAKQLCEDTEEEVDVLQYLGSHRRVYPTEYMSAKATK